MELRVLKIVSLSVALHVALLVGLSKASNSGAQNEFVGSRTVRVSFYSSSSSKAWAPIEIRKYRDTAKQEPTERTRQDDKFKQRISSSDGPARKHDAAVSITSSANGQLNSAGTSAFQLPVLERDSIIVPRFTDDALTRGFRGILVFELSLDEDGHVIETRLRNPSGLRIDQEAIASARNARYAPAKDVYGRPISSKAELSFAFLGH